MTQSFPLNPMDFVSKELQRLSDVLLYVPREPLLFPGFYRQLLEQDPNLTPAPLDRIKELGEPLAHGSEIVYLPAEADILHCCDPSHLAATHFMTVPFFKFAGSKRGVVNEGSGTGTYTIKILRGLDLPPGIPFYPVEREVTMYLHGPLCFELDVVDLSIIFMMIPQSPNSHVLEVCLYYHGTRDSWEEPFLPKIGEFFVRTSFAEDNDYLNEKGLVAPHLVRNPEDSAELNLPGLKIYQELYVEGLDALLDRCYAIAADFID